MLSLRTRLLPLSRFIKWWISHLFLTEKPCGFSKCWRHISYSTSHSLKNTFDFYYFSFLFLLLISGCNVM
ncbi:hypothetical protein LINPERHAP2_LOCUS16679 [Linum perenne]